MGSALPQDHARKDVKQGCDGRDERQANDQIGDVDSTVAWTI